MTSGEKIWSGTITHVIRHSGTDTGSLDQINTYDTFGNLGFQSKYFDQETGLHYFYNRYYSPTIGRFINEDPIGLVGGLNFYGFVLNDPVNWIDPIGFLADQYLSQRQIGSIYTGGIPIPLWLYEYIEIDNKGNREIIWAKIDILPPPNLYKNDCFNKCWLKCTVAGIFCSFSIAGEVAVASKYASFSTSVQNHMIAYVKHGKIINNAGKFVSRLTWTMIGVETALSAIYCYRLCDHLFFGGN